jgi:hypothetical protein
MICERRVYQGRKKLNRKDQTLSTGVLVVIAIVIAVGAMLAAALLLSGSRAEATHVSPVFLAGATNDGKRCSDNVGAGQTWTELKVEGATLTNGPHTLGPLTVTIANLTDDTFDWTSNIGVDAVVVKGGSGGSHLYRYDPPTESTGDTGLGVPDPANNGISHISFCYDLPDPTPTPTPTPTATPPAGATATPTATATPVSTAVLGQTQAPSALPATGGERGGDNSSPSALLLALAGLAILSGAGALAAAARRRR